MTRHLVVFVKAPRLGTAKTRLARAIGDVEAWLFYRRLTAAVLRRLRGPWRLWLAVTPDRFAREGRFWPPHLPRRAQGRGDIGQRMARPIAELPPGPVVIVGSDIPEIERDHVAAAFRALGEHDAVFGPARDGGYWLVGLRRRPSRAHPFGRGVRWSSAHALADTLACLGGRRHCLLERLSDIDTAADYSAWLARKRADTPRPTKSIREAAAILRRRAPWAIR